MKLQLIATATFGLEAVVKREIEALGYEIIASEDGRITFEGDERALVRANLWLRLRSPIAKDRPFQHPRPPREKRTSLLPSFY